MGVELVKWNFPQVLSFFSRGNTADSTSDKEHENATELAAEALADVIFSGKTGSTDALIVCIHPKELEGDSDTPWIANLHLTHGLRTTKLNAVITILMT